MIKSGYVETRFKYRGYPCVVILQTQGHRCGYVGLTSTSSFYEREYIDIDVRCHGGLTYARPYLYEQDDNDMWWIGFDCAHYGDGEDYETLKEYAANDEETLLSVCQREAWHSSGVVRSQAYVEKECMEIVDQLIELEKLYDEVSK